MRADNTSTFFGQAWLIINPLLLAAVYYILVTIIRRENDPASSPISLWGSSHSSWWAPRSRVAPPR